MIQCRRVHFASIVPLYSDKSHLTTYEQSVARHLEFSKLPCAGTKGMSNLLLENLPLLFGSPLSSGALSRSYRQPFCCEKMTRSPTRDVTVRDVI
ncbi:hypothetical protein AVEN_23128-1 [Araneus ventricosus]|uniref:Uncharacterized protein n=1 Tax=Araneus ventricosus TaxID=182803 RepID=A0A4Y2W3A9_ARAVE|nr:hypothetical protein AVEN_23128-1 [Araneus ventricosus]